MGCSFRGSCRLRSGWEPEARGWELPTLCTAKVRGTLSDAAGAKDQVANVRVSCAWTVIKNPAVPLFRVPPGRHGQLKLFLCYSAMNRWLYGMRHLRLCRGVELMRKPGLAVWPGDVGSQERHPGSACCQGASVSVKSLTAGVWLPGSLMNGLTEKFASTL